MTYEVLIIDDNATDRKILQRQLQSNQQFHIRSASGAHDALKLLGELPAHLVICDVKMPRVNGFELCSLIHTMFGKSGPKMMLVSGNPFLPRNYAEYAATFDDFCIKTPDGNILRQGIQKLLSNSE